MAFFRNFPRLNYKFGDEITPSLFQNLSVYIDLIDQIADDGSFYTKYTILDGDRPDVVSQKLYGSTDYYWTFYLLNENIRLQGWPLSVQEIYENSKIYYPHIVITTETDLSNKFKVGHTVIQGSTSNPTAKGVVVERNLNLGQLIIRPIIEVRSITVTNGGSGYIEAPSVTISGGGGSGATASSTIVDGTVTSINIINAGSGYSDAPTITLSDPKVVDYNIIADKIELILNGSLTSGSYYDFLTTTVSGFARGDVDNSGGLDSEDASLLRLYSINPLNVTPEVINKITTVLRPAILANAATVPDFVPGGVPGVTATATATLSQNTFSASNNILTNLEEQNNLLWQFEDITFAEIKGVVDQYDSIHHYEDTDGEWVDIDPYDQDVSTSGKIPVTVFDRLQLENDNLKEIKVLKPNVASQVFSEFRKVLTRR